MSSLQCWLLNPGHSLNYTWDNPLTSEPRCVWTVYGGSDDPCTLRHVPGQITWGEERIVYKTIKKSFSSSTSDTDSDEDVAEERRKQRGRISIATSNSVPQNIVYKHKKTVYWIADNLTQPCKTSVYFYTTRKAAMKHFNRIGAKRTSKIIISAPSANSSFFDDKLFEKFSIQCPPRTSQWFISINDSWRYFGWELSAALEVAYLKGLPSVNFEKSLKVNT